MRAARIAILLAAGIAAACGPATVRPVSFPNPDVSCPGGRLTWGLEIEDQRAIREAQPRVVASVREAIQKSFPGCRWGGAPDPESGTIRIEIHRFASVWETGSWEAAVDWTVSARDARGHTLTEFEANEEVSRPNYQGTDNEKESLSEAFRRAIERTARGLTAMSASGSLRHPEGTVTNARCLPSAACPQPTSPSTDRVSAPRPANRVWGHRVERISQPRGPEVL